jgi:beta-galactosidase
MFCWESLRHGAKGLLFWQYRKEAHGSEFGAYGLTDYSGGSTEILRAMSRVGKVLNENAALFQSSRPAPAPVAILFSYRTFMADWSQSRNNQLSVDSLSGYYRAFWDANISVDILHEEFLSPEDLREYRLIVLPNPAALAAPARPALKNYVAGGGTVLSDPYCCVFNPDLSLANEVPGDGLAEVFGCRELDIAQVRDRSVEVHIFGKKLSIPGSRFQEQWEVLAGTEILGTYADGSPALLSHTFGKGRAIISGLNLGLSCSTQQGLGDDFVRKKNAGNESRANEVILEIARQAGIVPELKVPADIRAGILSCPDGGCLLIALNVADDRRDGGVTLEGRSFRECKNLLEGGTCRVEGGTVKLEFSPLESKVLYLR